MLVVLLGEEGIFFAYERFDGFGSGGHDVDLIGC